MKCPLCHQTGPCLTKTGKLARTRHVQRNKLAIAQADAKRAQKRLVPCWTTSFGWLSSGMIPNDTAN